ncbi:MAG: site-specific integrase [Pseudoalteromonas sp.]|uniref:site-specific integrase n=1 Tax=Pseudoalteromonas sp. TaxID=53249 RepID=UPI001DF941BA|nr:site-specific integrase [Pseudoalteromonas sp.]NRA79315.1 site-specific integrase [Pseudoalteromonas sp.]
MRIELKHRGLAGIPIPYNIELNEIEINVLDFLIFRKKNSKFIYHKLKNASSQTIQNDSQRVKYLINLLAEQTYVDHDDNPVIGVHYCAATYENNMKPLIELLRNREWKEESIEQYVKTWRNFYRFLTATGVDHMMFMPDTIEESIVEDQEGNFLSHTNYSGKFVGEKETAIEEELKEYKDDYVDSIISMSDFWRLYQHLYALDEVYAVMAFCEFSTLLRVSALVRDFPLTRTKLNPHFKPFSAATRDKIRMQDISYIAKGGKIKKTKLSISAHKIFNDEYINSELCNYEQRYKKYQNNYCKTKWAKKFNRTEQMRFCWLNKNGTPVSVREYQAALENAADELGIKIHSHMMRHTGATQLLWRYLKEHNLTASHTNDLLVADAHVMLQKLLGHINVETTRMYVRTVERMIQAEKLSMLLNSALSVSKKHHDELIKNNKALSNGLSSMERAVQRFEEHMTGSNILDKIKRN